ncbi:GFA family protein [Vogesella facilis]|uniref:GFA family protein n=1 Tax=Vogesella facilis TaxID=1655232 RepID=A0ABV7RLS5_9NEIS
MQGRCLCGAVRYRVRGEPYHVTHCHCLSCRLASGAPFVTWFTVRALELEWHGEVRHYQSSMGVQRGFCPRCGTTLSYRHEAAPDEIDLTAATLENPALLTPEDHTWVESMLDWVRLLPLLPRHRRYRQYDRSA